MRNEEVVVNGVRLAPNSDFVNLFRRALQGESVFPSKTAYGPEDGVAAVLQTTRGTALEPPVRQAIMTLLLDSDPKVRAGTVLAIETFPRGFDGEALLRILENESSLFRNIPAITPGFSDLYWQLLRAVAGTGSQSKAVLDRLRASVADQANGHWLLAALTKSDKAWILDHAEQLIGGQPSRVATVLANLPEAQDRKRFIEGFNTAPETFRKEVAQSLQEVIDDPKERTRLTKSLSR